MTILLLKGGLTQLHAILKNSLLLLSLTAAAAPFAKVARIDFPSYAYGALVGQNGWWQLGALAVDPIMVAKVKLTLASILAATAATDTFF